MSNVWIGISTYTIFEADIAYSTKLGSCEAGSIVNNFVKISYHLGNIDILSYH